jgi:putative glycosyltransferase (TIGR04372 family)
MTDGKIKRRDMKYGIWRHENALGNSAEQTVCLCNFIQKNNDFSPIIYVETEFQHDYAMCIPNVKPENILFYDKSLDLDNLAKSAINNRFFDDIFMPDVYFSFLPKNYPSTWRDLYGFEHILKFPYEFYDNSKNYPDDVILMQIREFGTYWKRSDGAHCEPSRFVNPHTFFKVALHFANLGYKVVRIGDCNQTPMPIHENIIDTISQPGKRMIDDLYILSKSKVFLSCDSGVWPIAGGMKKSLVLSNITSTQENGHNPQIIDWLPKETSVTIHKQKTGDDFADNPLDLLISSVEKFL